MIIGPITLEAKVHVANDEENMIGAATYTLPVGRAITAEDMHRAIGGVLAAMPEGWRLLDGNEFFNKVLVKEKTGRAGNFAVPADMDYDVEALTAAAKAAYVPEPESADDERTSEDDGWDDEDDE